MKHFESALLLHSCDCVFVKYLGSTIFSHSADCVFVKYLGSAIILRSSNCVFLFLEMYSWVKLDSKPQRCAFFPDLLHNGQLEHLVFVLEPDKKKKTTVILLNLFLSRFLCQLRQCVCIQPWQNDARKLWTWQRLGQVKKKRNSVCYSKISRKAARMVSFCMQCCVGNIVV